MMNIRGIKKKGFSIAMSFFMLLGMLPTPMKEISPLSPIEVQAEDTPIEEERTAFVPLTYTLSSYPKGDDVEYKLTISKNMYPSSSVSFTQVGKGVLTYPVDINVTVVLGGTLITRRIQQEVKINTETGEFTISDSSIGEVTGTMDTRSEINVYGESKVPEGKHEIDKDLYENVYSPTAFNDIGGEDAINQMEMTFIDAITGQEMTTQLSTHMTLWQKANGTDIPILKTLQVIYLFNDIDTCRDENYTEGTCPDKGEHTFIQTKDSYYFAVDEVTRNIYLEQGTQTRYKLKWVDAWSDWNHKEEDKVWEDDYPRPDSTSLKQTITKAEVALTARVFKKLTLPDEEKLDADANEITTTMTQKDWVSASSVNSSSIPVKQDVGSWNTNDIDFTTNIKTTNYSVTPSANNWSNSGDIWKSGNHGHNSSSSLAFNFNITGTTTMSFDWSVSSESTSYDYVYYTITKNGSTVSGTGTSTKIGGTGYGSSDASMNYMNVTMPLDAGNYTVSFTYVKDGSVHSGTDTAYVKNFKISDAYTTYQVKEQNMDGAYHSTNHTDNSSSSMAYSFDLTRPATLDFDWSVHSESSTTDYGTYTITKDGVPLSGTGTSTKMGGTSSCSYELYEDGLFGTSIENMQYSHVNKQLESGKYTVTFTYSKNANNIAGFDSMLVKDFNVRYEGSYNPDSINNAYYSSNHKDSSVSTLSYSFNTTKKAILNFDWSCSSESVNTDYLTYTITKDGATLSGTGDATKIGGSSLGTTVENLKYANVNRTLDAGNYTITFTYKKDSSISKYLDTAYVKNFSVFYDIIAKPDTPDAIWMNSNDIWQSNNVTNESTNELSFEFSIENSGKLNFDYSVSSDSGDALFYTLTRDGQTVESENSTKISGTGRGSSVSSLSYIPKKYELTPGSYVLKFNYKKDANSASAGLDKGFIRNLSISEVREIIHVFPDTGDTSYLDEYPENAILLDQRDYKVYWQHIEEGQFLRAFSHDWTHKYIFQNSHLGGYGYVTESGHPASGMTIKFAMYAKLLKDGRGKTSEYYLARKIDSFEGNSEYLGDGSWYNGEDKDSASASGGGNTIYNKNEKFTIYTKYCDYGLSYSNGCGFKWNDAIYQNAAQNENGNNSCTHYHNTITDNNNVCASPNSCRSQSVNSCTNRVSNGSFSQPLDPDNNRKIREGNKTPLACTVYQNTGSYQTRASCNGCETYRSSCSHCTGYYWGTCSSCDGGYSCGSKGTSCCSYDTYDCQKCEGYETKYNHCCQTYYERTHYNSTSTYKTDGNNCGWSFPSNTSMLSVLNTDNRAPANAACGWTKEYSSTSYKHCGYKSANSPTLRTYYFKVNNLTEESGFLQPPYTITKSDIDKETSRYPLKMTSTRSRGSSSLQFDTGWYQSDVRKDAKRNYDLNEVREEDLIDAWETWTNYVDADTYREEWRTEYRWKSPISFDEKYTLDEQEAIECATQTGRYQGPIGSCVILEQITVPKYIEQKVTELLPGSRTSPAQSNLSVQQVQNRAELYAEGQYQLHVYQNMPARNLAVNNIVNSGTGFVGQEISTIKLKEDYQDAYVNFSSRKEGIKSSSKNTFLTTFKIWDIYMYVVGHSRYASSSNSVFTLSGKTTIDYPFNFTTTTGGEGCGPGLTPPIEGCPLGSEIFLTSLLLSNKIANKGMNSLVYTSPDGIVHYDELINKNDSELSEALCRTPEDYFFTVKNYDDVDALVNMIIAEQHFKEKAKSNDYKDDSFKIIDKYDDESTVDELFEFLMNIESSDDTPAMQAIKELEKTNIMEILKTERDLPEETFQEACGILGIDFDSPTELMEYYNKMKNAGLTLEDINEQYNITLTPADFKSYITNYRTVHEDADVHSRLAFIDYETAGLIDTFGADATSQNERIKEIVTKMCNK